MKKLLLLLFLIPLISCTEDWTGEKEVTFLQDRNGIKYEVNSEVGFTGKYVEYYKNGQKHIEEHLKLGKRNGLMTKWHENGQKKSEINSKNGEIVDGLVTEWHDNGQKMSERNFKNGKYEGLVTEWHDNGQKASEGNMKNGEVVDGVVTIWNKEGDVTETETYKDGKLVSSNNRLFKNIVDKILDELEN